MINRHKMNYVLGVEDEGVVLHIIIWTGFPWKWKDDM